ncbi:hypothetical protein HZS_1832 [Henneguya salminicola]|uniref:Mite group 2 allergen Lep d 2 (Trinotate prediction) n=1 Tax=Henneguya salminicola TaxID=69463 RepID=A0A6G3MJ35_HENSL|nr:hypothetical protein HZS_1832 [Henneguya salminicola]
MIRLQQFISLILYISSVFSMDSYWKICDNYEPKSKIHFINITGCDNNECNFHGHQQISIYSEFTALKKCRHLTVSFTAIAFYRRYDIPGYDTNGCHSLFPKCPLFIKKTYDYKTKIEIPFIPIPVTIKIRVEAKDGTYYMIFCFVFNGSINLRHEKD